MQVDIILINPPRAGKSMVGKLLAALRSDIFRPVDDFMGRLTRLRQNGSRYLNGNGQTFDDRRA